jgi:hypothetical protein
MTEQFLLWRTDGDGFIRHRRDLLQWFRELCRVCQIVPNSSQEVVMNGLIYLVGLVVVILAVLSFFGLR